MLTVGLHCQSLCTLTVHIDLLPKMFCSIRTKSLNCRLCLSEGTVIIYTVLSLSCLVILSNLRSNRCCQFLMRTVLKNCRAVFQPHSASHPHQAAAFSSAVTRRKPLVDRRVSQSRRSSYLQRFCHTSYHRRVLAAQHLHATRVT